MDHYKWYFGRDEMKQWKKCWGYVPVDFGIPLGTLGNTTQKIRIKLHTDTTRLRICFTNKGHKKPMILKHVTIGKWNNDRILDIQEVFCDGKSEIKLEPEKSCLSDEIHIELRTEDEVVISAYFKEKQEVFQVCQTWSAGLWKSSYDVGDTSTGEKWGEKKSLELFLPLQEDVNPCEAETGISGILTLVENDVKELAFFGDSITHMSFYFDFISNTLNRKYPGMFLTQNCGIGGNRLLFDDCFVKGIPGNGKCFGKAGIKRFIEDVYKDSIPDVVFIMEGINDCTHGFSFHYNDEIPDGKQLMEGMRQIIDQAHANGSKVWISTIMPFGCFGEPFRVQAEKIRQDFNELIRMNQEIVDGFVDLDEIVRKQENPHLMRDELHLGDGIHPNEIGGQTIGQAILETILKKEQCKGIRNEKD